MVAVSVVIPTYNGAAYIEETIESIRSQTLQDFEIVVSDDQSTDETVDAIRRIHDARIRLVVRTMPDGAAGNWNHALSLATGRYVKLLPQDDVLVSTCLERQVSILDAHDDCVMVASKRDVIDMDGRLLWPSRGLRGVLAGPRSRDQIIEAIFRTGSNVLGEPGAVLFRRDSVHGIAFSHDDGYVIDLGFYSRVLATGDCYADPLVGAQFRVHSESWTVGLRLAQFTDIARWMRSMRGECGLGSLMLTRGLALAGATTAARLATLRLVALRSAGR